MPSKHHTRKQLTTLLAVKKAKGLEPEDKPRFIELSETTSQQLKQLFPRNDKAITLIEPLTNIATYPMLILWSLILLAQFSLPALSVISAVAVCLTIPLGVLGFVKVNGEREKAQIRAMEAITLLQFKLNAIHRFLKNPQYSELLSQADLNEESPYALASVKKHRWNHAYVGVETSIFVAYTLFGTYYLGINAMMYVFGSFAAAAVLTGPAGLLIGLGACVLAGLYFGFNHYQASREESFCKARERELNKALNADEGVLNHYFATKPRRNSIQPQPLEHKTSEPRIKFKTHVMPHQFPRFFSRFPHKTQPTAPHVPGMLFT